MKKYKQYSDAERFFIDLLSERLKLNTQYLSLPSCTCFSYCINELIDNCRNYLESDKRINHLSMTENFFEFMKNEDILKSIDESIYYELLVRLQNIISNSSNIEQDFLFFKAIRNIHQFSYLNHCHKEVIKMLHENTDDYERLYNITNIYINELLFHKVNFRFLCKIFNEFYKADKFESVYEFLDYLMCDDENIEMYLPLKQCNKRDIQFISEKQTIIEEENNGIPIYYCKIYDNTIDYYTLCTNNMRRIESILNFFKFYRNSSIDFDYSENVKIIRRKLADEKIIKFSELMKYRFFVGKDDIIKLTLHNLEIINEKDNPMYLQINNILHYAEKDNDYLTASSYVDNWIALESLIRVSENYHGYEGVKNLVPNMLCARYFRQDMNACLKNAYYKPYMMSVEKFIEYTLEKPSELDSIPIRNDYYKYRIKKYRELLLSYKSLKDELERIEKKLTYDIERIYLVRNEYVHASNINTTNNMHSLILKRILADSMDCFIKSFNGNVKTRQNNILGCEIFSDIVRRYSIRKTSLQVLVGDLKISKNKIGRKQIISNATDRELLNNLIFERKSIFNTDYTVSIS